MSILDLGCGTGKQIFRLADHVSRTGFILGLDLSDQAIDEVNKKAKVEHLSQIRTILGSIDKSKDLLKGYTFDLILSSYAIYYAKNMRGVLCDLKHMLNSNGEIFVCGPGKGTNQEMTDLINGIGYLPNIKAELLDDFIDEPTIKEIATYYSESKTVILSNKIMFDSAGAVMQWWRNHVSFIPEMHYVVKKALTRHFDHKDKFILTKNILGVHYFL